MKIGKLSLLIKSVILSAVSSHSNSGIQSSYSNKEYYFVARLSKDTFTSSPQRGFSVGFPQAYQSDITFNAFLFWSIYVDLYQKSKVFADVHIGRTEIRLSEALAKEHQTEYWYWLHKKPHSPSSHSIWHQNNQDLPAVGQIKIALSIQDFVLSESPLLISHLLSHHSIAEYTSNELPASSEAPSAESFSQLQQLEYKFEEHLLKFTSKVNGPIGLIFPSDVAQLIQSLQHLVFLFGQGIKQSFGKMFSGYFLLAKFHEKYVSHQHTGNTDNVSWSCMEEMRIFWRFCLCSLGWRGLVLCGKTGNKFLTDIYRQDSIGAIVDYMKKFNADFSKKNIVQMETDSCREHFRPSYVLIRDKEHLVLSIRGTLDITDTNIDLACEYVPWKGGFVHEGILQAAAWFLRHLYTDIVEEMMRHSLKEFWITGHSLGAGTGSIFRILLREHLANRPLEEQFLLQTVKCIFFGCPPVISASLIPLTIDCGIVNIVNEYDIISHLCYGTVMDFREMLLCASQISSSTDFMFPTQDEGEAISKKFKAKMCILEECRELLKINPSKNSKLYIPGTIYHIYTSSNKTVENKIQRKYSVEKSDASLFGELVMRTNCFISHLPSKYDEGIEGIFATREANYTSNSIEISS
jgi:hypothetical protein